MINAIESGEMETSSYKEKIDNFIAVDKRNLTFFQKVGFQTSIHFISNRIKMMQIESSQLA